MVRNMSNGAAITIHGLCKSYGEKNVLKDLDISVKEASVTAIAGPSGCGKTTLLRIISGLESADKGQILISGQPVMMFQEPRLFNHLSAIENVLCVISPKIENIRKNAEDLLFRMGIDEKSQKLFPYQLSGGMQQRVSLTRTLLYDKAPIILLDEPLNGVDTDMKNKLYPVIKEYSQGKTVLMVSHDENDVKALSDNTIHLDFADNIG